MKPTIQSNTMNRSDSVERESRKGFGLPKTDYSYQAPSVASMGGRCFGACRPSFRAISQDYFKNEARHSFASEAAFFCVIMMTVAVSLVNSAHAMVHLVRSFATL